MGVKEARTLSGEEWPKATQLWLQDEARYGPRGGIAVTGLRRAGCLRRIRKLEGLGDQGPGR